MLCSSTNLALSCSGRNLERNTALLHCRTPNVALLGEGVGTGVHKFENLVKFAWSAFVSQDEPFRPSLLVLRSPPSSFLPSTSTYLFLPFHFLSPLPSLPSLQFPPPSFPSMLFSRLRPHFPLSALSQKFVIVGHTAGPAVTACYCLRFLHRLKERPTFGLL